MRVIPQLLILTVLSALLVTCEQKAATSTSPTASIPAVATGTAPPAVRPSATPAYAGTYTVQDSAVCALSITITKQANGYRFSSGKVHGLVQMEQQDSTTYFTFVGLKGADPADDVEAVWQDSMLVIQNYGNSMNQYLRFEQCDTKYLELIRQR